MTMKSRPSKPRSAGSAGAADVPAETAPAEAPFTVMIVDDVQDIRELYERYFELEGARAITAADGVSALQVVLFQRPDVIVLDFAMPQITGVDVIRSLKGDDRTRGIPVVVVSGQHDVRASALEAGADAYIQKPVLPQKLLAEVRRAMRGAAQKRA
jgi:CheY-like chemotaxis protein